MSNAPGLYLVIEFDWPEPISQEHAKKARKLHDILQGKDWIKEMVAGSGGLGAGPSSLWIFRLPDYAALDRLMRDQADEVCKAYTEFFALMPVVSQKLRDEVVFL